jgi:NAD(P)-dependent dehydrogenase (short-subunit alcohol dehydrogenase family)
MPRRWKAEQAIHEAGGTATIAPMDLTETDAIARLAKAVAERWGKLDILVVNAGVLPTLTPVTDIDLKAFNRAIATNTLATQALLTSDPLLRKAEAGRVIGLTTSVATKPPRLLGRMPPPRPRRKLLDCYAQEGQHQP